MYQSRHFTDGSTYSRSVGVSTGSTHTYGVSCGTGEAEGVTHNNTGLHGRARAAVVVQEITWMIQQLATEVAVIDFTWAHSAVDSLFDAILHGRPIE